MSEIIEINTNQPPVPLEKFEVRNWSVFGTYWVAVEVYRILKPKKNEDDENSYTYNPTLAISLDMFDNPSREAPSIDKQKVLTLSMDRYFTESKVAAIFAFQFIKELFARVSVNVNVYDESHQLLEQFDLNSFVEQGDTNESAGQN